MEAHIRKMFNDDILEKAGSFYGVGLKDLTLIGGFENFIYGFQKDQKAYVLRISHADHRSYEQTQAELDFVNYLADHAAHVSIPIRSIHGNLVEKIPIEDTYFMASAYVKAEGRRAKTEEMDESFLFTYGKSLGVLHRLSKTYKPDRFIPKRIAWDEETLYVKSGSFLSDEDQIIYQKFIELIQRINTFDKNIDTYGLIHTDFHLGNFFVDEGKFTVFDFDDCAYMWFVADIAIILYYHVFFIPSSEPNDEKIDFFMRHFMKGYLTENRLSEKDMNQMESFMKLRQYIMYIVFHRSTDVHSDGFPKRFVNSNRASLIDETPLSQINFSTYLNDK